MNNMAVSALVCASTAQESILPCFVSIIGPPPLEVLFVEPVDAANPLGDLVERRVMLRLCILAGQRRVQVDALMRHLSYQCGYVAHTQIRHIDPQHQFSAFSIHFAERRKTKNVANTATHILPP